MVAFDGCSRSHEDFELVETVRRRRPPRVLVVGDVILDRYTWADAERVSPEAPILVLRSDRSEDRLGGAANVAHVVRQLGATTTLLGVVGADAEGGTARMLLSRAGVACDAVLTDPERLTTVKERFVGRAQMRHPQQVVRVDREVRTPLADRALDVVFAFLPALIVEHDIVLVSDYGKGVCHRTLLDRLFALGRANRKRVLVDPVRRRPWLDYKGASCLTPNRTEAEEALGTVITCGDDALKACNELCERLELEAAIVTLDREGIALQERAKAGEVYSARPRQVYDVTGAGDVVLGVLGLCLAAGACYPQAVRVANAAGGLEVEKFGASPVTWDEVIQELAPDPWRGSRKILDLDELLTQVDARKRAGQRIVLTNGCFDMLHPGHLHSLEAAALHGDCLVVGLNSDASVKRLKGNERPILDQRGRALMLAALEAVDFVTIFDADTPIELLHAVKPNVLVKGANYAPDQIIGRDIVDGYGGSVVVVPLLHGCSTTEFVRRIRVGAATTATDEMF